MLNLKDVNLMIYQENNKEIIFNRLKEDVFQYAYHIGDLDDFFFPDCIWFGIREAFELKDLILLYSGLSIPTLLVFGSPKYIPLLIEKIISNLPNRFYCHFQKEYEINFKKEFNIHPLGTYLKMKCYQVSPEVKKTNMGEIFQLKEEDEEELIEFYKSAYPNGYFEPYMLQTGKYFGIRVNNKLLSVAGVHVFSKDYSIAVLGNIATLPEMRGRGLAKKCVMELLKSLESIDYIGLNVKENNYPALNLYKNLGFKIHSSYEEGLFERKK